MKLGRLFGRVFSGLVLFLSIEVAAIQAEAMGSVGYFRLDCNRGTYSGPISLESPLSANLIEQMKESEGLLEIRDGSKILGNLTWDDIRGHTNLTVVDLIEEKLRPVGRCTRIVRALTRQVVAIRIFGH